MINNAIKSPLLLITKLGNQMESIQTYGKAKMKNRTCTGGWFHRFTISPKPSLGVYKISPATEHRKCFLFLYDRNTLNLPKKTKLFDAFRIFFQSPHHPSFFTTRLLLDFLVLCVFSLFLTLMNDNSLQWSQYFCNKITQQQFQKGYSL